jgi:hypothetical protein
MSFGIFDSTFHKIEFPFNSTKCSNSAGSFNNSFVMDGMDNSTNENSSSLFLDCPVTSETAEWSVAVLSFWLEGVFNCVFAFAGLIGNLLAAVILCK